MAERKKRRNLFDDIFGEEPFEDIEEMLNHMFDEMGINMDDLSNRPSIHGFSISKRPGEEPEIHEFGNMPLDALPEMTGGQQISIGEVKPLVDIFETEDSVHVVAELPGVEKEDIYLDTTESLVELKASHGEYNYYETLELPVKIDPDSAKATYKNGVLEVIFRRQEPERKTSIQID